MCIFRSSWLIQCPLTLHLISFKHKKQLKDVEERDSLRNWQPPVSGSDIMDTFNLKEGKEVGVLKNQIREAILEGEIRNSREEALVYMRKKGIELGLVVVKNLT